VLYNPRKAPAVSEVRVEGKIRIDMPRVSVPPRSAIKIQLPSQEVHDAHGALTAFTVQVESPIVPMRVVAR
jgi:hypothetical protein